MPRGRLPNGVPEIMPALLMLVVAAELALKALWIRTEKLLERTHSLAALYNDLDEEEKTEIERRFKSAILPAQLLRIGAVPPSVGQILDTYSSTYGGDSNAYVDARYYAEPTTMFAKKSGVYAANLVKAFTPFPIYMPEVVQALLETFEYFAGPARLKRLGGIIDPGTRDPVDGNHGEYGLVPASLELFVIVIAQSVVKQPDGRYSPSYEEFKLAHPTGFVCDWMYGGATLHFYRNAGVAVEDGGAVVDGIECKVWVRGRVGLHGRDVNKLADCLEGKDPEESIIGEFVGQVAKSLI